MSENKVLYSAGPEAAEIIEKASRSAGARPVPLEGLEGLGLRLRGARAIILVPPERGPLPRELLEIVEAGEGAESDVPVVVGALDISTYPLQQMESFSSLEHVLACPEGRPDPSSVRRVVARLLGVPGEGLSPYLGFGVAEHALRIEDSRDKGDYVREVASLAQSFDVAPRFLEAVETVADELVTNAIFNAPVDGQGGPRYGHLSRREAVALPPEERSTLRFGCDGEVFGVAVRDPFGSLARSVVVRHLLLGLGTGRRDQRFPVAGGAGLGLCRVFEASAVTAFDIVPGERTEVVGIVPLRESIRAFKQRPKSLHFFGREVDL